MDGGSIVPTLKDLMDCLNSSMMTPTKDDSHALKIFIISSSGTHFRIYYQHNKRIFAHKKETSFDNGRLNLRASYYSPKSFT